MCGLSLEGLSPITSSIKLTQHFRKRTPQSYMVVVVFAALQPECLAVFDETMNSALDQKIAGFKTLRKRVDQ